MEAEEITAKMRKNRNAARRNQRNCATDFTDEFFNAKSQRRRDAKKKKNSLRLCAFAPLR